MKARSLSTILTILVAVAALVGSANADETSDFLADIHAKAGKAVGQIEVTVNLPNAGKQSLTGIGVCIDSNKGILLTTMLDRNVPVDNIESITVTAPGLGAKSVSAKLLGIEPTAGLGYVQVTGKHDFDSVQFVADSKLKPGQQVVSAGVLTGMFNELTLGNAYVSTVVRVPSRRVMVTGGKLTALGSVVFNKEGKAIGLVMGQLALRYQLVARNRQPVNLSGVQETAFFTPVEEFVWSLRRIPSGGKVERPGWLGINRFDGLTELQANMQKIDVAGVVIDDIIPNEPADNAGLKSRDVIVSLNGKPVEELYNPDLTARNFTERLLRLEPGSTATIDYVRDGKRDTTELKIEEMPSMPGEAPRYVDPRIGLGVREKVPMDRHLDKGGTADVDGLKVIGVMQDSPAQRAGFAQEDVVTAINGQKVKTTEDVKKVVDKAVESSPGSAIKFTIRRGDLNPMTLDVVPRVRRDG
ncbi:MAG: PDZ domain-containing protein [Phycisphaerae bacterium]